MKTIHKFLAIFILLIAVTSSQKVFANAAQPGVWNAGGTVFTMLYPEDSLTFKKVQMVNEKIFIQLYKGYAVVKGVYLFRNTTSENLHFKMGYPVNGIYSGGDADLNQVTLDSLSRFKIKANNKWLPLIEQQNGDYGRIISFGDNWKVWEMAFVPEETQTVEVYFIVNTNDAGIRKGYNYNQKNAFIYLLESGSVWKQPIEKGNFYVQLMDGLTTENINGISNGFNFKYNEQQKNFAGSKTSFSPTPNDNLVITYFERDEKFTFDKIVWQSENLFSKIDALSNGALENLTYSEIEIGNPYELKNSWGGSFSGLVTQFVIYAPFIIGFIVVLIIIWAGVKWISIKKRKNRDI